MRLLFGNHLKKFFFFMQETTTNIVNNFGFIENFFFVDLKIRNKVFFLIWRFWFLIFLEIEDGSLSNKGCKDSNWKVY